MTLKNLLFDDFNKVSSQEWKLKIQADLKGADYQTLITKTLEGIDIKPFYHYDTYTPSTQKYSSNFYIVQELHLKNSLIANKIARKALKKGVEYFSVYFDKTFDIDLLIKDIAPDKIIFKADMLDIDFFELLFKKTQGKSRLLIDPIGHFARYGNWYKNEEIDFNDLKTLLNKLPQNFLFIDIRADHYKNAGANTIQEVAYALGHAIEYTEKLGELILPRIQFTMAQGAHYFYEIVKIKNLKNLWNLITDNYQIALTPRVYALPALRNKTIFDPYVNLLRTGMEMMSAILGGADWAANLPFDAVFKKSNEFSERLARNQLIILKNEAYFNKALKSTEGDYFIEEHIYKSADKALNIFKNIEKSGGFLSQLYKGTIQKKIQESAEKEEQLFNNGEIILVGTNKYIQEKETAPQIDFYPFLKKRKGQTLIRPIVPKRLAEKNEKKRLEQLGIRF